MGHTHTDDCYDHPQHAHNDHADHCDTPAHAHTEERCNAS